MKRFVKVLAWVVGGLLLLVVLGSLIGLTLPESHSAMVARTVPAPPSEVWAAVTDVEGFSAWRTDIDRAVLLPTQGLPRWREEGPSGAITLEVTELVPPTRMVTRIVDEGLPFGGTWTYELAAVDGGTRVAVTEDGEIYNPLFRVISRFVLGYDGTLIRYLDALEVRMGGRGG